VDAPAHNPQDESIGDLIGQLIEDGRALAKAEVDLYKQVAARRARKAQKGIAALVAGGLVLYVAFLALVIGLLLGLATLIGPVAAGLVMAAVLGAAGAAMIRYGLPRMKAVSGDEEERRILNRESTP
jgi:hypothetical protein